MNTHEGRTGIALFRRRDGVKWKETSHTFNSGTNTQSFEGLRADGGLAAAGEIRSPSPHRVQLKVGEVWLGLGTRKSPEPADRNVCATS